jgi:enamine deaminase RidA (YjgF/YER057c/UK114 family)
MKIELSRNGLLTKGKYLADPADLKNVTKDIYQEIFKIVNEENLYLIYCENYVPSILEYNNGAPRYHLFNQGRREAWHNSGYIHKPAACALGSITNQLEINFIAGPNKPREIENPRQISAYNYPSQYGFPLFSRAVEVDNKLYVSGTASVVGHETVCVGDLVGQYNETMENLKIIIDNRDFNDFIFMVFVKHQSYLPTIQKLFPFDAKFIVCDICRDDLLLEITAIEK